MWRMGAGAFAGVFATVLTHPMDVIRARLTVQSHTNKQYKGLCASAWCVLQRVGKSKRVTVNSSVYTYVHRFLFCTSHLYADYFIGHQYSIKFVVVTI